MIKSNKSNIDKILKKALPMGSFLVHSWREAFLAAAMIHSTICNKEE
jgi:hypothetical protein